MLRLSCRTEGAMWWNEDWAMPWMSFGTMILIVLAAVGMAMMFVTIRSGLRRSSGGDAIEILRERYIRGEIDQAEFQERRRHLGG
jgi:putative membrane protein